MSNFIGNALILFGVGYLFYKFFQNEDQQQRIDYPSPRTSITYSQEEQICTQSCEICFPRSSATLRSSEGVRQQQSNSNPQSYSVPRTSAPHRSSEGVRQQQNYSNPQSYRNYNFLRSSAPHGSSNGVRQQQSTSNPQSYSVPRTSAPHRSNEGVRQRQNYSNPQSYRNYYVPRPSDPHASSMAAPQQQSCGNQRSSDPHKSSKGPQQQKNYNYQQSSEARRTNSEWKNAGEGVRRRRRNRKKAKQQANECSICLENVKIEHLEKLICNHTFHKLCITRWFAEASIRSCPNCRQLVS